MAGRDKDKQSGPPQTALERYLAKQKEAKVSDGGAAPRVPKRSFFKGSVSGDPSATGYAAPEVITEESQVSPPATVKPLVEQGVIEKTKLESRFIDRAAADQKAEQKAFREFSKAESVRPATRPGRFWPRVGASIIDSIFVLAIARLLIFALHIGVGLLPFSFWQNVPDVSVLIVAFFYYGWFYSQKGASLGKMAAGLQISEAVTGKRLGYWRAFFRETIGKFISTVPFFLGFLLVAFRKDRLALHDMIFDTRVTASSPPPQAPSR